MTWLDLDSLSQHSQPSSFGTPFQNMTFDYYKHSIDSPEPWIDSSMNRFNLINRFNTADIIESIQSLLNRFTRTDCNESIQPYMNRFNPRNIKFQVPRQPAHFGHLARPWGYLYLILRPFDGCWSSLNSLNSHITLSHIYIYTHTYILYISLSSERGAEKETETETEKRRE